MPAYFRDPNGSQTTWTLSDLPEVLSVEVDAALYRAAYSDTWTPGGTGLPVPMEVSVTIPITAFSTQSVMSQLYSLSQQGIAAIGYESPLAEGGLVEWERPVLAARALEVRQGGARYALVRMRFLVGARVIRLTRFIAENGDSLTTEDGVPIVTQEEV